MRSRAPLAAEVAALAWPAIVQGLLSTVVMFTDRLLLGRYDAACLGSMQVSGPLLWSLFSVFGAFGVGVIAVVGRAVGAGDTGRAQRTVRVSLLFAGVVGLGVGLVGVALREPIVALMAGAGPETAEVRRLAGTFIGIVLLASPFQVVGATAMTALQAGGDTRTPMLITVGAGLVNLVLSWALLFGRLGLPELGIAGSALGTVTAFVLHGAVLVLVLWRRTGPVSLRWGEGPSWAALWPVLSVSGAALGEKLIFHLGFLTFASLVGRLGPVAMAANQGLIAIESLGFIAASGFGVAAGALVAQKLGAGQPDQAGRVGWTAAGLGVGLLSAVSLLFLVFPEALVRLFSEDPEVVALGARCLRVAALAQPLMALADSLAGSLRGAGDTRGPMAVALAGPVLVRLAACTLLAFVLDLGLLGIWIGTTIDWAVRCVALALLWARGRWRGVVLAG